MRIVALLLAGGLAAVIGRAQSLPVYSTQIRPADVAYRVLETSHFDLIYDARAEAAAREAAAILESDLHAARTLIGVERRLAMPVVLNAYGDRGNGYVSTFPFKQEIEVASLKGSRLSARFPSWLSGVAPHELIHAAHAEAGSGWGMGAVIRPFAPDLARSFNLLMPRGVVEGVAVWHESRLYPGAGRLNDPRFRMQFHAAMADEDPWSLAQLLQTPRYGRPGNRAYIGGAFLHAHLTETYGDDFFRRLLDRHSRFPFLGFGLTLQTVIGPSPGEVEMALHHRGRDRERGRDRMRSVTRSPTILWAERGLTIRRPQWLNDSTLVVYVVGYATRPGFYRVDARTGRHTAIRYDRITEDYGFRLDRERQRLLFGRYVQDPFVPTQSRADLFEIDLATGTTRRRTQDQHVLAPAIDDSSLWALQLDGQFTQWVRIGTGGQAEPLTEAERTLFVSLRPRPGHDDVAILLSRDGRQGLYRARRGHTLADALTPWLVFRNASIYEAAWSPDGHHLLFSADLTGITNVYSFNVKTREIRQLTDVAYGALDPSVSPDGRWMAFIDYQHEAYSLVRQPFTPDQAPRVDQDDELPTPSLQTTPAHEVFRPEGHSVPYRAWRYLAPRMVYPTVRYDPDEGQRDGLGLGTGLAVQGADPLERWAYAAEAFYQDEAVGGRVVVETGRYRLRPSLSAFRWPEAVLVRVADAGSPVDTLSVRRDEWGVDVGLRLPVTLEDGVFYTTAFAALRTGWSQERLVRRGGGELRPYRDRWTVTAAAGVNYRLQANRRDLIPNSGFVLRSTVLLDVHAEHPSPRRAWRSTIGAYVPVSLRHHVGLRLEGGLLIQNRGSIFGLDSFLPRGFEDAFLGDGTFGRLALTTVMPLRFVDDGSVLVPVFVHALYAYGSAEHVVSLSGAAPHGHLTAFGTGLGVQFRFFYALELDLRIGVAYALEDEAWRVTFQ